MNALDELFFRQRMKESIKEVIDSEFFLTKAKIRRGVTHKYIAYRIQSKLNNRVHRMILDLMSEKGARAVTIDGDYYYQGIGVLDG